MMGNRYAVSLLYTKWDSSGRVIKLRSKIQDAISHEEALGSAIRDIGDLPDIQDCSLDTYTVLKIEDATERTDNKA